MISEPKNQRLIVRISDSDMEALRILAKMSGLTVSKFVRSLCASAACGLRISCSKGVSYENLKSILDNQL